MYDGHAVTDYSDKLTKFKQEGNMYEFYQEEFMRLSHLVQMTSRNFFS